MRTENGGKGLTPADIQELLKQELAEVEQSIEDEFQSSVAMIPLISGYLTGSGGKRLRPMLVIATSLLCGYNGGRNHIIHSTVMEYIHAASLLHDDVVDTADKRRGLSSANAKWGNEYPVLVGDFLFAKSFALMAENSPDGVVQAVSRATTLLAEGQILELVHSADLEITEEQYTNLIFSKTGALIVACCQIGGLLGGADGAQLKNLEEYGRSIGIAFQLVDDILDFTSDEKTLGKPVGYDLIEGHVTLPVIHTYRNCDEEERRFLSETVKDEEKTRQNMGRIMEMVERHGGVSYAREKAEQYVDNALTALEGFPESPYLEALKGLAEYIITRKK